MIDKLPKSNFKMIYMAIPPKKNTKLILNKIITGRILFSHLKIITWLF